ncbi:MAG: HD domain-containing protein [bacterium]|nr:HD domain-containing protein [bacterium]
MVEKKNLMDRTGFMPPGSADQFSPPGQISRGLVFSLRWKVALSFSVLLFLVTGLVFLALLRYQWVFLAREGDKRARSLAANLAVNARDPLLAQDDLRFGPIVESVTLDRDVSYAYLTDHQGKILYHSNPARTGEVLDQGVSHPGTDIIQSSMPIMVEDVRVGTAVVALGAGHIRQAMRSTAIGLLFPLSLGTAFGVVGTFFLTGVHVKRVERLEEAVRALGSGDLTVRVQDISHDEVGRLSRHFNEMVGQLHTARRQIERNFKETISALAAAVEAKDAYTRGHCDRVGRISVAMGERLDMDEVQLGELELAAILHDVGKIGVEAGVVGKVGPLTAGETLQMKGHPEIGARILNPLSSLHKVGLYVRHHHEHFDGSGYPDGLKADEIPLPARIILLVDAFDAMTTTRPYRKALTKAQALFRIDEGKGKQFDPHLVELFSQLDGEGIVEDICREVG